MGGKKHDFREIDGYAELLERNSKHFDAIKDYVNKYGKDTDGFIGILYILRPVVEGLTGWYEGRLTERQENLKEVADGTVETAEKYEQTAKKNKAAIDQIGG